MLRLMIGIAVVAAPAVAAAQAGPITHSDWTLDLHDGAVFGSVRIVGMGGAQVALAQGSAGTLSNPAAPATRPPTSSGWWDWDFHFDALEAVYTSDFDNNGSPDEDRAERHLTLGIAGNLYAWGVAFVGGVAETTLPTANGDLLAAATLGKLAVARSGGDETWSFGGALRFGTLTVEGDAGTLLSINGAGLEAGAIYRPYGEDLRIGATASLPITGTNVEEGAGCTLDDCHGRVLPERVAVPWQLAVGGAWRFGPTRWNQWVAGRWRDERSLTVAVDLVVTGALADGMGLEAFGQGQWQPAGRDVTLGARAGAEWEALPGRLRLRGGTYWEPSRYDGVGGRPHLTAGVEVGFFTFRFWWNKKYRLRVGATGDFAPRFGNAGLSFGFWG